MADQRDGGIAWCDESWNPVRGCSRVSPGCVNCYAERQAARFSAPGQPYDGLVRIHTRPNGGPHEPRWTGAVRLVPEHLADPLRWRRPRRVFVNSMSDLFHEALSDEDIAAVFGVMAAAPQHQFQVLTKRSERMREWFGAASREPSSLLSTAVASAGLTDEFACDVANIIDGWAWPRGSTAPHPLDGTHRLWPLPNVWLGVSVEDQKRADERIPHLLATPAAVRWVSYEPALGPVDFYRYLRSSAVAGHCVDIDGDWWHPPGKCADPVCGGRCCSPDLDWIVVGGESGPGARPFDLGWARSTIQQCREAGVPCFFKQGGTSNRCAHDAKGGHMECIPDELRVREWPNGT